MGTKVKISFSHLIISLVFIVLYSLAPFEARAAVSGSSLKNLAVDAYPFFSDDASKNNLIEAISKSLDYFKKIPPDRKFVFGEDEYSAEWLATSLRHFGEVVERSQSPQQLHGLIGRDFNVYQAVGGGGQNDMLVTGYYEPLLKGSLQKKPPYLYPLYKTPSNLRKIQGLDGKIKIGMVHKGEFVPYWTRAEIEENNLLTGNELVYLADPIDVFVLHVQGSGRVLLPDGSVRQVHYAAKNGRPYRSIGKYLIANGALDKDNASFPAIRYYLQQHKQQCKKILQHNQSYIFFKWGHSNGDGPLGCIGQPLTSLRSIALDQSHFPAGALAFLQTSRPEIDRNGKIMSWQPMSIFVLNQDSGSAIKGPGRVDLFWGAGEYAEIAAGNMKQQGKLFFLVKKKKM